MTRRSDLMCEDLFGCDHSPEIPISEHGEIVEWRCRCGRKVPMRPSDVPQTEYYADSGVPGYKTVGR